MELLVLGPLEARRDGDRVELRPVERRLVAALVACRPASARYDALAEAVWGDAVPRSATHSLQTHVLRVRTAVGPGWVDTVVGGYRLGDQVTVDVDGFEAAVRGAAAADGDVAALAGWEQALAYWRGVPFEELADWGPAVAERARLMELWELALEERCSAAIAVSPVGEVVADAEALVQAQPLRERRWSLLLLALDRAGRRPDAVRTFDRARRTLATELGISPGVELSRLYESLLRQDDLLGGTDRMPSHAWRPTGNLPASVSSLVGRHDQIDQFRRMLVAGRLVTLTGAGGVGKTRLALAVAEQLRAELPGGAWFVDLAATANADDVEPLVASALGAVPSEGRSVRATVIDAIGHRELLVVLDNCEHLLEAVAAFVGDVLAQCPALRLIATSRAPLAVAGEQTMRVPSLPVDGAAIELFVARAREADPSFTADADALAAISRRLDGIPLAIELAAARVRTLGLPALAARLDDRFDLLMSARRGRIQRHHTLRAAIDWSYDLLDDAERRVFARLAVFVGRFELEAAEHVAAGPAVDDEAASILASLVDKSMVVVDGSGPARFRLLEPLRHYAAERLAAVDETNGVAANHARYYAGLAERLAIVFDGPDEIDAAARLDAARANFRAAFTVSVAQQDTDNALGIPVALGRYAATHVWTEPWSWCLTALDLPGAATHPRRAAALTEASQGAWQLGQHARCVELAEAAIALTRPGDEVWLDAQRVMAVGLMWLGRLDEAEAAASAAVAHPADTVTAANLARRLTLALIRNYTGRREPEPARRLLDDARVLAHPTSLALAFHTAGVILGPDDPDLDLEYQRAAARLAAATGAVLIHGFALAVLADIEARTDPVRGARALVEVMAHYLRVGNRTHLHSFGRMLMDPLVTCGACDAAAAVDGATREQPTFGAPATALANTRRSARAQLGASYDVAAERGATMTDDELVSYLDGEVTRIETQRHREALALEEPPSPNRAPV